MKFRIWKQENGRWCVQRPDGEQWWGSTFWDVYAAYMFMSGGPIIGPVWNVSRMEMPRLGMLERSVGRER